MTIGVRFKRFLLMVCLVMILATAPTFAFYTFVQDTVQILNTAMSWVQTLAQYGKEVQQWISEYQRLMEACKAMASGDFSKIMGGIEDMFNTIGDSSAIIEGYSDATSAASDSIYALADGTAALYNLHTTGSGMLTSLKDTWANIASSWESLGSADWSDPSSVFGNLADIGDMANDTIDGAFSSMNSAMNVANSIGNLTEAAGAIAMTGQNLFFGEDSIIESLKETEQNLLEQRAEKVAKLTQDIQSQSGAESNDPTIMQRIYEEDIAEIDRQLSEVRRQIEKYEGMKYENVESARDINKEIAKLYKGQADAVRRANLAQSNEQALDAAYESITSSYYDMFGIKLEDTYAGSDAVWNKAGRQ